MRTDTTPLRFELTVQTPSMDRYHQPPPYFRAQSWSAGNLFHVLNNVPLWPEREPPTVAAAQKKRGIKSKLKEAPKGFCSMLARTPALCFFRNFLCFRFSGLLKAIKKRAMSNVRTIVCCSKYYQNDFRCEAKVPRREALASDNLALIFFSLLR